MQFDSFDGIFAAVFEQAPDYVLTFGCAADGTWSAEIDYANTEGAPSPVDAIGIVLMQIVRDEELVFYNTDEVNKILLGTVGEFANELNLDPHDPPVYYEVYRNEHGVIGAEWEAVLAVSGSEVETYAIENGYSPGEALRNLIRTVHTYGRDRFHRHRRDTPPAVAQFAEPPAEDGSPEEPAQELVEIEETA